MTNEEQVAAVEDVIAQTRLVRLGRQRSIKCPFCGEYNMKRVAGDPPDMWIRPGKSPFCCDHFEVVANAVVGRFLEESFNEASAEFDRVVRFGPEGVPGVAPGPGESRRTITIEDDDLDSD